jgi:hypothetical protein
MTEAIRLVEEVRALGIEMQCHRDTLRYRPVDRMPAELLRELRRFKPVVIALLLVEAGRALGGDDLAEAMVESFEERLSIATQRSRKPTLDQLWDAVHQLRGILDRAKGLTAH